MHKLIEIIYNIVWSELLIILCLLSGLYYSCKYKFPQITLLSDMINLLFQKDSKTSGISSFQAFTLAISGRIGTGNIAGVATAIAMGGPGALFWMWIIAFLGSSSAIVEATLGQLYKTKDRNHYLGGPAYYISRGLNSKKFAILFSLVTIVSTGFLLPSVQSNSIVAANTVTFGISSPVIGVFLVSLLAIIILGGVKRIGKFTEIIVPFMAVAYIIMALVIIVLNIQKIPDVFSLIVRSGLSTHSLYAGIIGSAIAWGVKRGIYSNEAGQGTAPHAAAAAEVSHPIKQGLVQGFSVYIDTLFVCTATGLMILFTNQYNVLDSNGGYLTRHIDNVEIGPAYTQLAIATHFPKIGSEFVAISLAFFAFTTILAYYYIAETNLKFLFNKYRWTKYILQVILLLSVYIGSVSSADIAWKLGDIGVGLMAWINLIALYFLRNTFTILFNDYKTQKKKKLNPVYVNTIHNINNVECWRNENIKDDKENY